jgi:hemin uptake protein HemP
MTDYSTGPGDPGKRPAGKADQRTVDAQQLFAGERQIELVYKDTVYRLIITRNDKLILQK